MTQPNQQSPSRAYRGPVRRLRIVVSNGEWRVVKSMLVSKMSLRAHWNPQNGRGLDRANYFEVLDPKGKVVYRQRIQDPTDTSVEVFDGGEISRVDTMRDVTLDILAPESKPIGRVRLVIQGKDLPFRNSRNKLQKKGYDPQVSK